LNTSLNFTGPLASVELRVLNLRACGRIEASPDLARGRSKRIIEAAKNGERDPIRLQWQAVMGLSFDDVPMPA
jgi:hypothetical protein